MQSRLSNTSEEKKEWRNKSLLCCVQTTNTWYQGSYQARRREAEEVPQKHPGMGQLELPWCETPLRNYLPPRRFPLRSRDVCHSSWRRRKHAYVIQPGLRSNSSARDCRPRQKTPSCHSLQPAPFQLHRIVRSPNRSVQDQPPLRLQTQIYETNFPFP